MSRGVRIVDAEPSDAAAIKAFMREVIASSVTREPALFVELVANVEGNVDWWLQHPQDAVHLKATQDGALVGVVLVKQHWNLCSLFVGPALHGQGLGRGLVEAAAQRCAGGSPKQALWVNAAPAAVGFYRRLGFTERQPSRPLPPGFAALQRPL